MKIFPQQVEYVSCQMTPHADRSHRSCVEAFAVDWNEILQCVESDFATQQQLGFEQVTGECDYGASCAICATNYFRPRVVSHELGADGCVRWENRRKLAHWPRAATQRHSLYFDPQHQPSLRGEIKAPSANQKVALESD